MLRLDPGGVDGGPSCEMRFVAVKIFARRTEYRTGGE